jgi:hypothetical protein
MSMLERWGAKFRAADADRREEIVEEAADQIKNTWRDDVGFNRGTVISVRRLSTRLG